MTKKAQKIFEKFKSSIKAEYLKYSSNYEETDTYLLDCILGNELFRFRSGTSYAHRYGVISHSDMCELLKESDYYLCEVANYFGLEWLPYE